MKIPLSWKIIAGLAAIIIILIVYGSWRIGSLKGDLWVANANVAALNDTLRTEKTKSGQLESVQLALVADKKSFESLNAGLSAELKKRIEEVKYLSALQATIKTDTITIANHPVDTSIKPSDTGCPALKLGIRWGYNHVMRDTGARILEGITRRDSTVVLRDEIRIDKIVTGLQKRKDGKYETFVQADFPGLTFGKIQSAVIDPAGFIQPAKKRRFSVGPSINADYDMQHLWRFEFDWRYIRVTAGLSCQWSWFNF